jgi:hypothetical protein
MTVYATYPQTLMGIGYAQFAVLPVAAAPAVRFCLRSGRAVPQAGVSATGAITVNGTGYAQGASLAALSARELRRLIQSGQAG